MNRYLKGWGRLGREEREAILLLIFGFLFVAGIFYFGIYLHETSP